MIKTKMEFAEMFLGPEVGVGYPLQTRKVIATQIVEAAADEFNEHLSRRGGPEYADPADLDLASQALDRIKTAVFVMEDVLEKAGGLG